MCKIVLFFEPLRRLDGQQTIHHIYRKFLEMMFKRNEWSWPFLDCTDLLKTDNLI